MKYKEAYSFIESTKKLGSRPGLDNITQLCALLNDPQNEVSCIHIAGTNGKGSISAMIESVLRFAGNQTGLYISPHLTSYRDSMYVNGVMISKEEFAKTIDVIKNKVEILAARGIYPTEFEILTAAAFLWFKTKGCDVSVIETGMGGRLDATNVIEKPLVSIITAISRDHTAILGDTIADIAREKCGIVKPAGITACYPIQEAAAWEVIKKAVQEKNNKLVIPQIDNLNYVEHGLLGSDISYNGVEFHLPLLGKHQAINAITALEAVLSLKKYYNIVITEEQLKNGMEIVCMPARQEVLKKKPLILLDGAHNLQGIEALAHTMKNNLNSKKTVVVMGMLKDKQYEKCIKEIALLCEKFIAVRPESERALDQKITAQAAAKFCGDVSEFDDYGKAYADAVRFTGKDGAVVICGSLYLAGPIRKLILGK